MPTRDRILGRTASPLLRLGDPSPLRSRVLGPGGRPHRGAGGGALALPTDANLFAYEFDSESNTLDANDDVEILADLLGNGNDLTTTGALGDRAPLVEDAVLGATTGSFNGLVNGYTNASVSPAGTAPFTMYVVCTASVFTSNMTLFRFGASATNFRISNTSGLVTYNDGGTFNISGIPNMATATAYLYCLQVKQSDAYVYINDLDTPVVAASGLGGSSSLSALNLGRTSSDSFNWNGTIGGFYVCSGEATTEQRTTMGNYLAAKYTGLSLTLPA